MRLVHPQERARGAPGFDWFDFRSTRVAEAYPQLAGLDRPVPVVSGGPLHTFQSFLALNPILAADIGWRPAQDGLFRWVNDTGELMAESIWWRQGIMAHNGHGWHNMIVLVPRGVPAVSPETNTWRNQGKQLDPGHRNYNRGLSSQSTRLADRAMAGRHV